MALYIRCINWDSNFFCLRRKWIALSPISNILYYHVCPIPYTFPWSKEGLQVWQLRTMGENILRCLKIRLTRIYEWMFEVFGWNTMPCRVLGHLWLCWLSCNVTSKGCLGGKLACFCFHPNAFILVVWISIGSFWIVILLYDCSTSW